MNRTTLLVAFLFTGLVIHAVPAGAQTPPVLVGEGEQRATALAFDTRLFPQPSLPLLESGLRLDRLGALNTAGGLTVPGPRVELPMAFASLQEVEDPNRELKKYIGIGLMVVGGINTLYGLNCLATAHSWGNACWPYLGVSAGIGVGGWILFKRNR